MIEKNPKLCWFGDDDIPAPDVEDQEKFFEQEQEFDTPVIFT